MAIQKLDNRWGAVFNTGDAGRSRRDIYIEDAHVLPAGARGAGSRRHSEILGGNATTVRRQLHGGRR
jgi:hypothetical protein